MALLKTTPSGSTSARRRGIRFVERIDVVHLDDGFRRDRQLAVERPGSRRYGLNEADEYTRVDIGFRQSQDLAIARFCVPDDDLDGVAFVDVKILVEVGELDEDRFALMKHARCHEIQRARGVQYRAARVGRIFQRSKRAADAARAAAGGPGRHRRGALSAR
ncbi:MAG: hypothetical protein ACREVE_16580 [Gammaproteobacteria bacterium]